MNAGELCPAVLHDRPEERAICIRIPQIPGAFGFICRRCLEATVKGAADRETLRQEWEVEE
jgi:hypothetical protein